MGISFTFLASVPLSSLEAQCVGLLATLQEFNEACIYTKQGQS